MLAFVIAALPASGAAYGNRNDTPVSVSVNLPDPQYTCAELLVAASKRYHTDKFPKNSETIGKLYASAIVLEAHGHRDSFDDLTLERLIAAYSDVMGCFVSHRTAGGLTPSPSPTPLRTP